MMEKIIKRLLDIRDLRENRALALLSARKRETIEAHNKEQELRREFEERQTALQTETSQAWAEVVNALVKREDVDRIRGMEAKGKRELAALKSRLEESRAVTIRAEDAENDALAELQKLRRDGVKMEELKNTEQSRMRREKQRAEEEEIDEMVTMRQQT